MSWRGVGVLPRLGRGETGGRFALSRWRFPPGASLRPFVLSREDEILHVTHGRLEVRAGGRLERLEPGSTLRIGRGAARSISSSGESGAEAVVFHVPAGLEDLIAATGRPLDGSGTPMWDEGDERRLRLAAPASGVDLDPGDAALERAASIEHVPPGGGPAVAVVGDIYRLKLRGEDTSGALAFVEAEVFPGAGPPPHIHHREEEGFWVLEGELSFLFREERFTAGPGALAFLPRNVLHAFRNTAQRPARALIIVSPAGLERFFLEVGAPVEGPSAAPPLPDPAEIEKLLARAHAYGLEILAPPGGPAKKGRPS